jgi:hypothetical protein
MPYKVRKPFQDLGKKYVPGDIVEDQMLDHYPRPESMIRGGFLVHIDAERSISAAETEETRADPEVLDSQNAAPVFTPVKRGPGRPRKEPVIIGQRIDDDSSIQ